jgi:hypothetical protein
MAAGGDILFEGGYSLLGVVELELGYMFALGDWAVF